MVTITGDMSQAQIDAVFIDDLRARVMSRQDGEQVKLDRAQAARILQLLEINPPGHAPIVPPGKPGV
jgi:hypothetical protein